MVDKRHFDKIKDPVSLLAYGCMRFPVTDEESQKIDREKARELVDLSLQKGVNYFDTAYIYHGGDSEVFIGEALSKYPRDSFYLANKLPTWLVEKEEDIDRLFNEQLERCKVDYFDFYLVHALNVEMFEKTKKLKIYENLLKKKKNGQIRHLGFSFHDTPEVLQEIAEAYEWDFALLQINYYDWSVQNAKRQYEILVEQNIPCMVMEPVRGGALATLSKRSAEVLKAAAPDRSIASFAIRYVASLPNVITILSGMSSEEQLLDNCKTLTNFEPLSEEERKILNKALAIYASAETVPCTACRYCECPFGVAIPEIFTLYNKLGASGDLNEYIAQYTALPESAKQVHCTFCKKCLEHCPQKIDIPEKLKLAASLGINR